VKKYLAALIIALAILGLTARAFCYSAEAIDLSGRKYFPAVKEALSKAKELMDIRVSGYQGLGNQVIRLYGIFTLAYSKTSFVSYIIDKTINPGNYLLVSFNPIIGFFPV
jgi:hypothetical protein